MHTSKKTAAAERVLQTSLLPTPAKVLPPSPPEEPRSAPELPAEVRREQARRVTKTFGTGNEKLALHWIHQVMSTLPAADDESQADLLTRVWPAIEGIAPQDEIEGMLAVQMVAVPNVALDQLRRAAHPHQNHADYAAASGNAAKLLRVFREHPHFPGLPPPQLPCAS